MSCCWVCNATGDVALAQCQRCHQARYCSPECQRRDWRFHKRECASGRRQVGRVVTMRDVNEVQATMRRLALPLSQGRWLPKRDEIDLWGRNEPLALYWPGGCQVKRSSSSSSSGRGLFATRLLRPGVVVTYFPAHLIWRHSDDWHSAALSPELCALVDDDAEQRALLQREYTVQLGEWCLTGMPQLCHDERLLGHMANDAACCDPFFNLTAEQLLEKPGLLLQQSLHYYQEVQQYANASLECNESRTLMALVVRRETYAGEELLVAYGLRFWLRRAYGTDKKLEKQLTLLEQSDATLHLETRGFRARNGVV